PSSPSQHFQPRLSTSPTRTHRQTSVNLSPAYVIQLGSMKSILIFLLGLSTRLGTSAINPYLDPTNAGYSCILADDGYSIEGGHLDLHDCGITDEDIE
ncbi:unnamed protein product, partial [Scytosiphon promiscuus]